MQRRLQGIRNGNIAAAWAEGNGNEKNANEIRGYKCQGVDHYARNCTVKPRKKDSPHLQTQLQIDQKKKQRSNSILKNLISWLLQQASTSGTQSDKAPIYDSDGSAENDSYVISAASSVEQSGGTVEQNFATVEETCAYFESLYNNLAVEVEKVNTVNRKMKETNVDLTTEHAIYRNQEKCFEINQEKYDKIERCYQKFVYQEKCLTKKINALHLSSPKTITTLNEEIANLNNQLSKEKSIISDLQQERKKLNFDFKISEDKLLDKQIQLEQKIKELDNILVKSGHRFKRCTCFHQSQICFSTLKRK
ncbi:hypothetical protein Tco_0341693 [Tanacetum coccineum]